MIYCTRVGVSIHIYDNYRKKLIMIKYSNGYKNDVHINVRVYVMHFTRFQRIEYCLTRFYVHQLGSYFLVRFFNDTKTPTRRDHYGHARTSRCRPLEEQIVVLCRLFSIIRPAHAYYKYQMEKQLFIA